jgi:hypothetical protein
MWRAAFSRDRGRLGRSLEVLPDPLGAPRAVGLLGRPLKRLRADHRMPHPLHGLRLIDHAAAFHPDVLVMAELVERWFRELTDKALRRGVFHSVPDLITAIEAYLTAHNNEPKPFIWTATADDILAKVARGRVALAKVS